MINPTDEAMIILENVSKWYGDFNVLFHCSARIHKGEVVVGCEPSGSGKSTLIKPVNGLEPVQSGKIFVNNTEVTSKKTNLAQLRSHVGMVFQHFELFPHLNIIHNLVLAQEKVLKRNREESMEKAQMLLKRVGLEQQTEKYPSQLSGGQQQRVAIARALCMDPVAMLFDEPTAFLDPRARRNLINVLKALPHVKLIATHDLAFAEEVCERSILLKEGGIFADGPSRELLRDGRLMEDCGVEAIEGCKRSVS